MGQISVNVSAGPYTASGSQTAFPFSFSIMEPRQILVEVDGVALTTLAGYTVTFGDTSGTVNFGAAPAAGAEIFLISNPDYRQTSNFGNQSDYNLDAVNQINKRNAIRSLVLKDAADRAIRVPIGETVAALPAAADRAGRVLGFSDSGAPVAVANDSAAVASDVARAEAAADLVEGAIEGTTAAATSAAADADRAEHAADAAALASGIYANEAAGRAAVADGVRFAAVGSTSDKAVDIWQRVNSSSSTLLRSYPSLATLNAALASLAQAYAAGRLSDDSFVGGRLLPAPPSCAASVVGDTYIIPGGSPLVIPCQLTVDELADPTATLQMSLQIVSGSAGTAFSSAILRWYNTSNIQTGADVALTKTATAVSLNAAKPSDAVSASFIVQPPADTTVRHLVVSIGAPSRPTVDPWYLALVGAGAVGNDPKPVQFQVSPNITSNYSFPLQRVIVPPGGGSIDLYLRKLAFDGDVVWMLFSSPTEPSGWIQTITDRYGVSAGKGGTNRSQYYSFGPNRWAVALFVQSADAANDFSSVRFTWNNTGSATYAYDIQCFVGPNPPFLSKASKVTAAAITDAQKHARGRPVVTFAGDSTEVSGDPYSPDPQQALNTRFGDEVILRNLATPGNTLVQAAVSVGLLPVTVNLSGGYIPASTAPVTVTSWPTGFDPLTSFSFANPNFDPFCWIAGVFGYLSSDGTWSGNSPVANHLFFTPIVAPPYPIEVPNGTPLILRAARESKGSLIVFPISSVNGVGGFSNNPVAFVDAVFAAAPDPSLLAGFAGLQPNPWGTGASTLAAFSAKSYSSRLFDINVMSAATVAEAMAVTGWTWAAGENAAWTAGTLGIPASMRIVDGFHPYTDPGVYVLAKNWRIGGPVAAYIAALS